MAQPGMPDPEQPGQYPHGPQGQYAPGPQGQYAPQQPPKKPLYKRVWFWVVSTLMVITVASCMSSMGETGTAEAPAPADDSSSEPVEAPEDSEDEAKSERQAAREKEQAEKEAAEEEARAKEEAEAAAVKDPSTYSDLDSRELSLIVKDPDAHKGEKVTVYGYVMQADAATGADAMLVNLGASSGSEWYEYTDTAFVEAGEPGLLAEVVEDDLVTIHAVVDGSLSYDTQIGGNTTVPQLTANIVEVTGSAE